jgi:predicted DNA-binding ArsR family transcriptional regulator
MRNYDEYIQQFEPMIGVPTEFIYVRLTIKGVMNKIKVINEPSELVPMLRAVDTPIKREVLKEVTMEWRTAKEIEDKYGADGKEALKFFEKMKLVETRWQPSGGQRPEKAYHTYYNQFHINASWPVYEISDVLSVAMMPEEEFEIIEVKILAQVGKEGKFAGDVAEALGITSTMLKSLVKRSVKLDYRGHRLELVKDA